MLDGFKCSCIGGDAEKWLQNPLLDFGVPVSVSTGEVLAGCTKAQAENLVFSLNELNTGGFSAWITGSLHKFKNAQRGGMNWDDFKLSELHPTLERLSTRYGVTLDNTKLHGLEIGVNIELNYPPARVFRSAICHNGKAFDSIDRRDKRLGIICEHTDYIVKIYDKGHQARLSLQGHYILRYEIKVKRQRMLEPYGIKSLADLKRAENVAPLVQILTDKLAGVVFFDFSFDTQNMSDPKRIAWERYGNPKYWEVLNRNVYHKARKKMDELTRNYGAIDGGRLLSEKVILKWGELMDIKQENRRRFPRSKTLEFWKIKQMKQATFSKLEYVVENVANGDPKTTPQNHIKKTPQKPTSSPSNETPKVKRYCVSCNREITHLKKGARFCSEKERGREAKKCRNADSNRRMIIKRKIMNLNDDSCLIRVTYRDTDNLQYSDILGMSEINVSREWLDRVESVEIMSPPGKMLKGKKAKKLLLKKSLKHEKA
jgi:hypothetical protein